MAQAARILAHVKPPTFPHRTFDITRYGALMGGTSKCTDSIREAISACNAAGGGHVVVPAGTFLTGAIHLLSNVDLHLEKGATLAFSQDPNDYLPVVYTRWQGIELMNYSPFIYAFEQENVGVTGEGTLDGQADNARWWPWKGSSSFGWQPGVPTRMQMTRCPSRWRTTRCRWKRGCSARGTTCGPTSSSPTAAGTSSSPA